MKNLRDYLRNDISPNEKDPFTKTSPTQMSSMRNIKLTAFPPSREDYDTQDRQGETTGCGVDGAMSKMGPVGSGIDAVEHDMWTSVCNILDERPNEDKAKDPKEKRIRVYTKKAEVQELEGEICVLEANLHVAKRKHNARAHASLWERAAKQQRVEKNKAIQDNQQLQLAIQERNDYIEKLQRALRKTPRWNALPRVDLDTATRILEDPVSRLYSR